MSFEEAYKQYLIYGSKHHKKQSFDTFKYKFNLRVLPFFKDYKLDEITSNDILDWQNYILTYNFNDFILINTSIFLQLLFCMQ